MLTGQCSVKIPEIHVESENSITQPGKLTNIYIEHGPVEIVDLPDY